MATLYDSTFESFCNKKKSKLVIFKEESQFGKNPLVHFVLPTSNIITSNIIIITVFYCLLMLMHSR